MTAPPADSAPVSRPALGRPALVALGLVLVLAGALRIYRLDFDLPEVQYVDAFKFVDQAAHMVDRGDLHPTHFQYPGLYTHLLVVLYRGLGLTTTYGRQLAATAVSALAGLGIVAATAYAARGVAGAPGTVVAAALAAASPTLLTESRTPAPDTLCVLFTALALAVAARRPAAASAWAAAGASVGLAVGAKWTGAFAAPVLAGAAVVAAWQRRSARLLATALGAAALAAVLVFLLTTPFFLPLRDGYTQELAYTVACERGGMIGRVQLGPLDYLLSRTPAWETPWLGSSLPWDLGLPALLLAAGGLALATAGRLGFAGACYAATAVAYIASISGTGWIKAIRFLLPAMPLLWALAGACAEHVLPAVLRRRPLVWLVAALVVTAVPLQRSLRYAAALRLPSTNALVRDWMRASVPPGSIVFLGPFFTDDLYALPFRFQWLQQVGARQYGLPPGIGPSPERSPIYGPELVDGLRRAGVQYLVLNSYFDGAFTPVAENVRFFPRSVEGYAAFAARLAGGADLVHEEIGWDAGRLGPDIRIWRLR